MAYSVHLLPEAEIDIDEVVGWYKQIDVRLAGDFLIKLDLALQEIRKKPFHFQRTFKNYRKVNLTRFPFKIIYRIEKQFIIVIAIGHHKRRAKYWRDRE